MPEIQYGGGPPEASNAEYLGSGEPYGGESQAEVPVMVVPSVVLLAGKVPLESPGEEAEASEVFPFV